MGQENKNQQNQQGGQNRPDQGGQHQQGTPKPGQGGQQGGGGQHNPQR